MPFNIKESDRIRTDEIPALAGITHLILGSGSENKREAFHAVFAPPDEHFIVAKCPQELSGKKESDGIDAVQVAKEKGDQVDKFYPRSEEQDNLIVAGDVVFVVWKPGDDVDQGKYLNRFDRGIDYGNPESVAEAQVGALTTAEMLYCNGEFYVVWHVGTDIRRPKQGWRNSSGIRIKAKMRELPRDLVIERAGSILALKDNSIVNMVSLVGEYAEKVTISNRTSGNIGEVEVDPNDPLLPLLVLGCALPHALLAQLVSTETPISPDGTRALNFKEFDIMRARE